MTLHPSMLNDPMCHAMHTHVEHIITTWLQAGAVNNATYVLGPKALLHVNLSFRQLSAESLGHGCCLMDA